MTQKKIITQAKGFHFAGLYCGIKESSKKMDLALIYSTVPAIAVASFTTNLAKAAPVLVDEIQMKSGKAQAILINSGNANACTGEKGLQNAWSMLKQTAEQLKIPEKLVLISSTGKIGVQLPLKKISQGIKQIAPELSPLSLEDAAKAILTTDLFPKFYGVKAKCAGKEYSIIAFAKGAGMIEPAMKHATMLGYFMTDLNIARPLLRKIFSRVIDRTFNRISVDGDMSTNDTAILLANGLAENEQLKEMNSDAEIFEKKLEEVAQYLALKMVEDGEGATKVVEIRIEGAKNEKEARLAAYSVARSELVKTSFFGQDPNWGRVFAAVGYSGATFDPKKIDIYYGKVKLVSKGVSTAGNSEAKAHEVMKAPYFTVRVQLNKGDGFFRMWTSDLNYNYVKINAEYRT